MIIGHLPAGYIISKLSYSRFRHNIGNYRTYMFWGLFGSIAPDLDMFYFHLIDHRRTLHHKYPSHFPIVWFSLVIITALLCLPKNTREKFGIYAMLFSVSGFCHLILDTIVGNIWWFAPFSDQSFALATVPSIYKTWWVNFIFHWSFLLELAVTGWAFWLWKSEFSRSGSP